MGTPTFFRSYVYDINNVVAATGSASDDAKMVLLSVKNGLKSLPIDPWVVIGSSNGIDGSLDGLDRWLSIADLNPGTGAFSNARSWIVLRQSGINLQFQILIDLNCGSDARQLNIYVSSESGFTGGTELIRPIAVDEVLLPDSTGLFFMGGSAVTAQYVWHVIHAINGTSTKVLVHSNGVTLLYWDFEQLIQNKWNNAAIALAQGAQDTVTDVCTHPQLVTSSIGRYKGYVDSYGQLNLFATTEFVGTSLLINDPSLGIANDLSSEWPITVIGLATAVEPNRGRHAALPDLWFGALNTGDSYPSAGPIVLMQIGDLIFPWPDVPLISS